LDTVLIEDKSSGSSLIQDLRASSKFKSPVIAIEPKDYGGDKLNRAATSSPAIEAGLVYLPETATWLPEYETEVSRFPNSANMDQVDSTSQYLNWSLGRSGGMGIFMYMQELYDKDQAMKDQAKQESSASKLMAVS
jgi:predicted phage terminase large subunit-like protein